MALSPVTTSYATTATTRCCSGSCGRRNGFQLAVQHGIARGIALAVEIGHDPVGVGMDTEQAHRLVAHGPETVGNVGGQRHAVAGVQMDRLRLSPLPPD